jgi:hypothetical protein
LGGWNACYSEDEPFEDDRTNYNFYGKLRKLCPTLFFSLSSWERDSLDKTFGTGTLFSQSEEPCGLPEIGVPSGFVSLGEAVELGLYFLTGW